MYHRDEALRELNKLKEEKEERELENETVQLYLESQHKVCSMPSHSCARIDAHMALRFRTNRRLNILQSKVEEVSLRLVQREAEITRLRTISEERGNALEQARTVARAREQALLRMCYAERDEMRVLKENAEEREAQTRARLERATKQWGDELKSTREALRRLQSKHSALVSSSIDNVEAVDVGSSLLLKRRTHAELMDRLSSNGGSMQAGGAPGHDGQKELVISRLLSLNALLQARIRAIESAQVFTHTASQSHTHVLLSTYAHTCACIHIRWGERNILCRT